MFTIELLSLEIQIKCDYRFANSISKTIHSLPSFQEHLFGFYIFRPLPEGGLLRFVHVLLLVLILIQH